MRPIVNALALVRARRVRACLVAALLSACRHAPVTDVPRLTLAGRWDESIAALERALAARRGDRAHLLVQLSEAERERALARGGDLEPAISRAEEARAAATSPAGVADAMDAGALAAYWRTLLAARGDWGPIERDFREALALRRPLGDHGALADSLFHVGLVAQVQGRDAEAAHGYAEALAEARAAEDPMRISYAIRHQADLAEKAGQPAKALASHRESLRLREQAGFTVGQANALVAIASLDRPNARAHLERARALVASVGHLDRAARADDARGLERRLPGRARGPRGGAPARGGDGRGGGRRSGRFARQRAARLRARPGA